MRISAPFGYTEIVPFLKTQRVHLLAVGELAEFVQRGNTVPISHGEFQPLNTPLFHRLRERRR